MFLLKLSLRPLKREPIHQVLSALSLAFLSFLFAFLFWFQDVLSPVIDKLRNQQILTVYLKPELTETQRETLQDTIRSTVSSISSPSASKDLEMVYVSSGQFLEHLGNENPELKKELALLGADVLQMVPRYFSLGGVFSEDSAGKIQTLAGVEAVDSSSQRYGPLLASLKTIQWVVRVLLLGVLAGLVTGYIHIARLNGHLLVDAVGVLRSWGAGVFTLRAPSFLSSLWIGLLASSVSVVAWVSLHLWMGQYLQNVFPGLSGMASTDWTFGFKLFGVGIFLAAVGGISAPLSRNS